MKEAENHVASCHSIVGAGKKDGRGKDRGRRMEIREELAATGVVPFHGGRDH
jgi:hypothetical protein